LEWRLFVVMGCGMIAPDRFCGARAGLMAGVTDGDRWRLFGHVVDVTK
jgi:hypothetical protein